MQAEIVEEDIGISGVRERYDLEYSQALGASVEQDEAVGHAVRENVCVAMADLAEKMPIQGLGSLQQNLGEHDDTADVAQEESAWAS